MTPAFWHRLQTARVPFARYRGPGRHVEVDKTRQVLFEVASGRVVRAVHVSTGATGNTPVGRWHVYSKVPGFLPSGMFYSSFFVGAFAIHGYPSVPALPRVTRVRPDPDVDRPERLRLEKLRRARLHLPLTGRSSPSRSCWLWPAYCSP